MQLYRLKDGTICTYFNIQHRITTDRLENIVQEMGFMKEKVTRTAVLENLRITLKTRGGNYLDYNIPEDYGTKEPEIIAKARELFPEFYQPPTPAP